MPNIKLFSLDEATDLANAFVIITQGTTQEDAESLKAPVSLFASLFASKQYYAEITGLTGGGATNLDGLVTVGVPARTLVEIYPTGGPLQKWLLTAGTETEDTTAGRVRPDDYNTDTNAKYWLQVA
jgi:hypothetical protein